MKKVIKNLVVINSQYIGKLSDFSTVSKEEILEIP
jgi:hypothetical protein